MKNFWPLLVAVFLPPIIFAADELPAVAVKETAAQVEKDWVDSRWQQMDMGSFLASTLQTPAGVLAKGLSIRVGDHGEASVGYDLAAPALRAAWTGGFLNFSPSRFGLGAPPVAAGEWAFATPAGAGWLAVKVRHEALHLHGQRVVIDTRVGDARVRETPWFERAGELKVFTRTFEASSATVALTHRLLTDKGAPGTVRDEKDFGLATLQKDGRVTAIARRGGLNVTFKVSEGSVDLSIPGGNPLQRVKLLVWSGPRAQLADFEKYAAASSGPEDLAALLKPGPARWLPALTSVGQIGFPTDGFAVDTLTAPYNNPWKALLFCSGVDFFRDGSAAVCTIHGDVWRVSGLDDKLRAVTWKRYATGLFQPLGLRVVNDRVHVLGRDQITVLHDDNGDGEADRYENFCNLMETSTGGHDFVTCLERDGSGNFFYVDPIGVHRISADGRTKETLAAGFRNPNGLGVSRDGVITVTPQQGTWTPSSVIFETKRGGYYGYGGPKVTPQRPLGYDAPLCWLPHAFDNSSSSQTWVPANRWGALGGQMLHFAWGRCAMMLVLRDVADGQAQGAAVALPVKFLSGPMRGTFHPQDGHLYVAGSTGWQTSAARDGCLQRVRYTGKPLRVPVAWRAHQNGIALTFAQPLERAAAEDAGRYAVHQWNYLYSANYGSKDYSVANPGKEGRDEMEVRSATLQADGRTVFLELPGLRPVMQMELKYNLPFAGGGTASSPLYLTLNRLGEAVKVANTPSPSAAPSGGTPQVKSPPPELNVPVFYKKYLDAGGYPIVASAAVNDYALKEAAYLINLMLARRPDVRAAMIKSGSRLCIMAHNEFTTDLPEWAKLTPKDYWDARARGMGGSQQDPLCSCAEENLLAYPGDPYAAENILIHEFAHNIHLRGLVNVDATFDPRVKAAFDAAMKAGLWKGKYASVNHHEYFAEGVQSWFDNNRKNDHDHNHVNTRALLLEYDPGLAALCREVFGETVLKYTKPNTRLRDHLAGYDPAAAPKFTWPERLTKTRTEIKQKAQARSDAAEADPTAAPKAPAK